MVWDGGLDGQSIYGARMSPAGVPLDPNGIVVSAGHYPAVASVGSDFLVVWNVGYETHGVRVNGGKILGTPAPPGTTSTEHPKAPAALLPRATLPLLKRRRTRRTLASLPMGAAFLSSGQIIGTPAPPDGIFSASRSAVRACRKAPILPFPPPLPTKCFRPWPSTRALPARTSMAAR